MRKFSSGSAYPLGSTCDGKGVNFAIFSANAEKIELCLFDKNGAKELERYELKAHENNIWHPIKIKIFITSTINTYISSSNCLYIEYFFFYFF